jgi:hypothetical protein
MEYAISLFAYGTNSNPLGFDSGSFVFKKLLAKVKKWLGFVSKKLPSLYGDTRTRQTGFD